VFENAADGKASKPVGNVITNNPVNDN